MIFLDLASIDTVTITSYTDEKIFSVPTLNDDTSAEDGEITAEIQARTQLSNQWFQKFSYRYGSSQ